MTNEFTVVGENRHDETELLVMGTDGQYYEYNVGQEQLSPIEPDDHWELFSEGDDETFETSPTKS